jgi:hypothetical protein
MIYDELAYYIYEGAHNGFNSTVDDGQVSLKRRFEGEK